MNRIVIGALAALLLASSGVFWWQGRAQLARGVPPPDLSASAAPDAPIDLPEAGAHGRGAALPSAGGHAKPKESPEERRFNRYDRNRNGEITRTEMMSTRVKAFQKLDTNHDNLLSFEEWAVKTSDRFTEMDANHDGVVTRAEMEAWQAAHQKKPRKTGCVSARAADPGSDEGADAAEPGK